MAKKDFFDVFFEEKKIPPKTFEVKDKHGNTHFIDNEFVISLIKSASQEEKKQIEQVLRKLTFITEMSIIFLNIWQKDILLHIFKRCIQIIRLKRLSFLEDNLFLYNPLVLFFNFFNFLNKNLLKKFTFDLIYRYFMI